MDEGMKVYKGNTGVRGWRFIKVNTGVSGWRVQEIHDWGMKV